MTVMWEMTEVNKGRRNQIPGENRRNGALTTAFRNRQSAQSQYEPVKIKGPDM